MHIFVNCKANQHILVVCNWLWSFSLCFNLTLLFWLKHKVRYIKAEQLQVRMLAYVFNFKIFPKPKMENKKHDNQQI